MSGLSYRTRGNSSPRGKERVYFTCYPSDFQTFFEPICADIFESQNCAIWYHSNLEMAEEDTQQSKEEMSLDLGQMQLFVIPITSRFLYKPNSARDVELPFAMEHHIPVLPLMQERGLEGEFNRICGDMQFLDKLADASDLTTLPYKEKLKKFLSSVLLGDDMVARVKAAFDAYIFLSYRKKDRKYAQELMRLIHKNPFCRDMAIWYDEFLVPGENFNDAIRDALEKSSLFAMVVTPNMVNEVNYVMTTEYPKAAEKGMPVLPAQMVETDTEALQSFYPGIYGKDVTDAHDEEAMKKAIECAFQGKISDEKLKKMRNIAISDEGSTEDPQHLFFIGLAYLGGIDVEVDVERAVELITDAADDGLAEAIRKLVDMYRNGDGVPRNMEAAIEWQKKLVEIYRNQYEQNRDEASGQKYFFGLWNLSECIWFTRNIDETEKIRFLMVKVATQLTEAFGGDDNCRYLGETYGMLGDIWRAEGNYHKAEEYYEKSFLIFRKMESPDVKNDLSVIYDNLGDICKVEEKTEKAREYYQKALDIRQWLVEEQPSDENCHNLSISYLNLGQICQAEGMKEKAWEYYERSLSIKRKLAEETNTSKSWLALKLLLTTYACAGTDVATAKKFLEEALHISEKLDREQNTISARLELSESYRRLADVYGYDGDLEKAEELYEKSLLICEEVAVETETVLDRITLAAAYVDYAGFCEVEGKHDRMRVCYERALHIREKIMEETGSLDSQRDLSQSCSSQGWIWESEGNYDRAREYYEKELDLRKNVAEITGTLSDRRRLASSYEKMAEICEKEEKPEETWQYYELSLQLRKEIAEEAEALFDRRQLNYSYERMIEICKTENKPEEARQYCELSLQLWKEIAEETGTAEDRRTLSFSFMRLGDSCIDEDDVRSARKYYREGMLIREKLAKELDTFSAYEDLAYSCTCFGAADDKNPDYEILKRAADIWEQLSKQQQCPSEQQQRYAGYAEEIRQFIKERGF